MGYNQAQHDFSLQRARRLASISRKVLDYEPVDRIVEAVKAMRGLPRTIVLDRGPEMSNRPMFFFS